MKLRTFLQFSSEGLAQPAIHSENTAVHPPNSTGCAGSIDETNFYHKIMLSEENYYGFYIKPDFSDAMAVVEIKLQFLKKRSA